jgi:hypothetical protein
MHTVKYYKQAYYKTQIVSYERRSLKIPSTMELLQNASRAVQPAPVATPVSSTSFSTDARDTYQPRDDVDGYSSDGSYCTDASEIDALRQRAYVVLENERVVAYGALQRVCERTGIPAFAHITKSSDIADIRAEGDRIENEVAVRRSIKFQRRALLTVSSGVEYMHNKSPLLKGRLTGWGEAMLDGIDDFDVVFRRLHAKHGPRISNGRPAKEMEPEIELLYMIAYNAFTFSVSQSIAKLTASPMVQQGVPGDAPQVDDAMAMMQARVRDAKSDSDRVRQFTEPSGGGKKGAANKKGKSERVMQL